MVVRLINKMDWRSWGIKLIKRQGEVTMTIVREGVKTLETLVILGCRLKFLSVGASPSLLNHKEIK